MEFDFSPIVDNWRFLARGLQLTLLLALATAFCATILGMAVALARLYGPGWLKPAMTFYIDTMRAVPVLVVLVWTFFAFPILTGLTLPPFWAALAALTIHIAAYVAEIIRAGILSVDSGQRDAAAAMGFSRWHSFTSVVLPQAMRVIIPPTGSQVIALLKGTSLVSVIAMGDLLHSVQVIYNRTYEVVPMLLVAVIWYLVVVTALTLVQRRVERHFSKGMSRAAVARRVVDRTEAVA